MGQARGKAGTVAKALPLGGAGLGLSTLLDYRSSTAAPTAPATVRKVSRGPIAEAGLLNCGTGGLNRAAGFPLQKK